MIIIRVVSLFVVGQSYVAIGSSSTSNNNRNSPKMV